MIEPLGSREPGLGEKRYHGFLSPIFVVLASTPPAYASRCCAASLTALAPRRAPSCVSWCVENADGKQEGATPTSFSAGFSPAPPQD